jgi:hypothetical protein
MLRTLVTTSSTDAMRDAMSARTASGVVGLTAVAEDMKRVASFGWAK